MIQSQLMLVETTVASEPVARKMAADLIKAKVAACVHVDGPIESHYEWKKTMKADKEFVVRARTVAGRLQDCIAAMKKSHTYDVPGIIILPVLGSNKPYAEWISEATKGEVKK